MPVTVQHLSITHQKDLRPLIVDLSLTLDPGDRLAIIGEEGDGKSTLLKLLYDPTLIEAYASYEGVVRTKGEKIGYLPQEWPAECADMPIRAFLARSRAYREATPDDIARGLSRLKLSEAFLSSERPAYTLSGGEKIKAQLLLLLCANPTVLLLDEPSNDLDIDALRFLERFIRGSNAPVMYISHDETLLKNTATRVLHLEQAYRKTLPRWTLKNVPYETYMAERERTLQKQEKQALMDRREERVRQEKFERIQNAVDFAQSNISRQDPHGGRLLKKKMKAVKSLEKRFEREREDMVKRPNIEYAIDLTFDESVSFPRGKTVCDFSLPALTVGGRTLARDVALRVVGPEKVVIVGQNGGGKTTFLRLLADSLAARRDITAAYMPQRYEDALDERQTPVEFLHTRGDKAQLTEIRTHLGALKFTTEEMEHPISGLSGGQKAKLLFLRLVLARANVLILDEPTRNLSPLSAPVVRALLRSFPGAVIAVTHDRLLISALADRVLELTETGLKPWSPERL